MVGAILVVPAAAQFGSIFGDGPPRPPSNVPDGRPAAPPNPSSYPPPQGGYPQQGGYPPQDGDAPQSGYPQQSGYPPQGGYPDQRSPQGAYPDQRSPQGAYPDQRSYPPQGGYPPPRPGGSPAAVQQRPLPPPPDSSSAGVDPAARAPVAPAARPRGPQPADTSPQPGDEVVTEPPSQKIANSAALFSGLDKITGRIINFDVAIGETVQFGALQITPRACYTRPPTEPANTDAFIEVDEVTLQGEVRRIFTGWMFAASPGLHAVEHPIYDVWLTNCKGGVVTAEKAADPPPAPAAAPPARTPQAKQPRRPPPQQGVVPSR